MMTLPYYLLVVFMKKWSDTAAALMLSAVILLLIAFSNEARAGATNGIRLCERTIIPALLPVLICCNWLLLSRASLTIEIALGRLLEHVFHLPRCCAAAVLLGLTGGYPTGALLTASLFRSDAIDEHTAARLMCFNFSGGCAFIITAVGSSVYGSQKTGVLLYSIHLIAALLCAWLMGCGEAKPPIRRHAVPCLPEGEALSAAAERTVKALALMSVFIILFSALNHIVQPPAAVLPLLEITAGICAAPMRFPLPQTSFFLAFGGLCLHFQILPYLREMHMPYGKFLFSRLFCAVLSALLTKAYLLLFPTEAPVFSNVSSPVHQASMGGAALSAVMIIGCAVVIFDIEGRKLKFMQ